MNELRILFAEAADTGYRAQLADARGRRLGVEVPFTPFLTEEDYEDLRWYLEEYMDLPDGGAVLRAQRIEGELGKVGPPALRHPVYGPGQPRVLEGAARRSGAAPADPRHPGPGAAAAALGADGR